MPPGRPVRFSDALVCPESRPVAMSAAAVVGGRPSRRRRPSGPRPPRSARPLGRGARGACRPPRSDGSGCAAAGVAPARGASSRVMSRDHGPSGYRVWGVPANSDWDYRPDSSRTCFYRPVGSRSEKRHVLGSWSRAPRRARPGADSRAAPPGRRSAIMPSVLRGCVRAPARAPRAERGVRPPQPVQMPFEARDRRQVHRGTRVPVQSRREDRQPARRPLRRLDRGGGADA